MDQGVNVQIRKVAESSVAIKHVTTGVLHDTDLRPCLYICCCLLLLLPLSCCCCCQVDDVVGDGKPTVEQIRQLKLTTRVINEAMRLYPQPPVLIRRYGMLFHTLCSIRKRLNRYKPVGSDVISHDLKSRNGRSTSRILKDDHFWSAHIAALAGSPATSHSVLPLLPSLPLLKYCHLYCHMTQSNSPLVSCHITCRALEDDKFDEYTIRKGSDIFISVWNLHRSPQLWPQPNTFNPDRFPIDGPVPNEVRLDLCLCLIFDETDWDSVLRFFRSCEYLVWCRPTTQPKAGFPPYGNQNNPHPSDLVACHIFVNRRPEIRCGGSLCLSQKLQYRMLCVIDTY